MTLTIDLPHDLERELSEEAARQGLPLSDYAVQLLIAGRPARPMPTTGADLVRYWESEALIRARSDVADSAAHARELRQQSDQRRRE